jgi:DNA-binding transcriptional LysR family regulator
MSVGDVAPNEWECQVFVAVAEQRTYAAAANSLSTQFGKQYTYRAVGKVIDKIDSWLQEETFVGTGQRKQLTDAGETFLNNARSVVEDYRLMRNQRRNAGTTVNRERAPATGVPTLACLPHHVPFAARAEAQLLNKPPAGQPKVVVECLEHRHQSSLAFRDHAVHRLRQDAVQLITGPHVSGEPSLVSKELYVARLEVMVPGPYAPDEISVADLINRFRLFLAPKGCEARRMVDEHITALTGTDATAYLAEEHHDTATSVLRVRNFRHQSVRTLAVIAPSDIALAFKHGKEFGGQYANEFRWVPLVPAGDRRRRMTYRVCVTTKRRDAARLVPIVEALRKAAETQRR